MGYENYDHCFPDQPVVDLYLPVWANHPSFQSKPAFIWVEDHDSPSVSRCSTLTYSHLNHSVNSIASNLLTTLNRRDTVLILCSSGLQLVQILFGCQRAGLLSVPTSPPHPSFSNQNYYHLVRVLSQTKPKAAIAHQDYITEVQTYLSSPSNDKFLCDLLRNLKWIPTNGMDLDSGSLPVSSIYTGCTPDEVYLIQYTSGTTGIPKPILVTTGAVAHNVRMARKAYDLNPSSRIVSWLPQYHDCGLMFLLLTVVSGATCVLTSPTAFVKRPRLWLEMITEFKGTCTPVPSFALPLVVRRGRADQGVLPLSLGSLRSLLIVNEPLYRSSVEEFLHEFASTGVTSSCISPSYGLSENGTLVSTSWRNDLNFASLPSYNKLLPSGKLALTTLEEQEQDDDMKIIIVNEETLEIVDDGVEGEIWISSPSNAKGYHGYPSLTQEVFQARVRGGTESQRFVRTGDRGIIRGKQRYFYVVGRCSDVIKVEEGGKEVYSHFLETAAYNACTRLLRAGCIAAFEISKEIVIVAELQRSEGDGGVLKRVCDGIRDGVLKEEGVEVGRVVLVKSGCVPKTTSGKVQRWLAKDKLMRGEMKIVGDKNFGYCQESSVSAARGSKMEGKDGDGAMAVCSSSHSNRPSLMSFL